MKLQYFCHAGDSEIGGFAVSAPDDPLYVERFETVLQGATPVTIEFSDDAVADYFDSCVDQGLKPQHFGRIWCHTHPGESAEPSGVDEQTFERVFGTCDWALMFILSRTSETYARLSFSAGPGGAIHVPVCVDWERLPTDLAGSSSSSVAAEMERWQQEYVNNVHIVSPLHFGAHLSDRWRDELDLLVEDLDDVQGVEDYIHALDAHRVEVKS